MAWASIAAAQTLKVQISVTPQPAAVEVHAEFPEAIKVVSFANAYANVFGLAERIKNVNADSRTGPAFRKLATGEFESASPVKSIWYQVDLSKAVAANQESHVSSLNTERGVLMLADLLPRSLKESGAYAAVSVKLSLPTNWESMTNATRVDRDTFFSRDPMNAVFVASPKLKVNSTTAGPLLFSVGLSGDWPVSEKDILKVGKRILDQYAKLTRFQLAENPTLIIVPYSGSAGAEHWTAETRGNSIVLFIGNRGNKDNIKSRIAFVLAHELFHLWVPNSLNLAGDYDWFFEGFTVYQALRTDLRLKLISLRSYLDTIASVYDAYRGSPGNDEVSLTSASGQRWTGASSALIYNKATLVAFLYDLALRKTT
ncbi:MAG TPA: hypothetical protein VJT50_05605, partial [Pyrinomonadaceae bacterium]|nr:hypothetical protein [Pyrinomonadaceae bacterium]